MALSPEKQKVKDAIHVTLPTETNKLKKNWGSGDLKACKDALREIKLAVMEIEFDIKKDLFNSL
jgi:hypothetical protein